MLPCGQLVVKEENRFQIKKAHPEKKGGVDYIISDLR